MEFKSFLFTCSHLFPSLVNLGVRVTFAPWLCYVASVNVCCATELRMQEKLGVKLWAFLILKTFDSGARRKLSGLGGDSWPGL